jgi:hypothetical protein
VEFSWDTEMKYIAAKHKTVHKPLFTVAPDDHQPPESPDHHHNIATAAFYIAEKRGFLPGLELHDWLEAEAKCDARIA